MPDFISKQYITEFHSDIVKATATLPAAASYTGSRFSRTSDHIDFYSDGTRWLSTQLIDLSLAPHQPIVAATGYAQATSLFSASVPGYASGGFYIERVGWMFSPFTGQTAALFYTPTLEVIDATTNATTTVTRTSGTADTQSFVTAFFYYPAETVYGSAYTNKNLIRLKLTPTGAAGTFLCFPVVQIRLIG